MEFPLSQAEFDQIKKAASMGKSMVWFDDIVISIPHITFMRKIRKKPKTNLAQIDSSSILNKEEIHEKVKRLKEKLSSNAYL